MKLIILLIAVLVGIPFSAKASDYENSRKVIMIDGFVLFTPAPLIDIAEKHYPGRGKELFSRWRDDMFKGQWLRALARQYRSFESIAEETLQLNLQEMGLAAHGKSDLLGYFQRLDAWPDTFSGLSALKSKGYEIYVLSNMTQSMIKNGIRKNNLDGLVDKIFSTDTIFSYKPAPEAYNLGAESVGLINGKITFVAFASWDAAGASWFGYNTFWMNRAKQSQDLQYSGDVAVGYNFEDLMLYLP